MTSLTRRGRMSKIRKRRGRRGRGHKVWQLQEAKARFSELVNEVIENGHQTITKNGHPVAVIISQEEFERIKGPENTLVEFFLEAPFPELDLDLERSKDVGRDIDL